MTMQVPDPFIWEKKKYTFIGADNVYELFDPGKFGFDPEEISTACWKGFVVYFIVNEKNELILNRLDIRDRNDNYPPVNGVEGCEEKFGYYSYKNINLPLNHYSGTIIIANDVKDRFIGSAFLGPYSYNETYELEIKNGKVVKYKDTSGTYKRF